MRDVEPTAPGSNVTGSGFVVDLFGKLESLRVSAHESRDRDKSPVRGLSHTLQESTMHQILLDTAYMPLIEGRVLARLETLAVLREGLGDGNEFRILLHEPRQDV